jgi:uncharacterized protein
MVMSIKEKLQTRIKECMRSGNSFERDVLKTVLGEIQGKEMAQGKGMSEEACEKVFKKFKQGVEDTLKSMAEDGRDIANVEADMNKEISIYDQYIPKTLSLFEVISFLTASIHNQAIMDAKSDGQATGIAMKAIKEEGLPVDGKDVSVAVKTLRVETNE